MKAGKRFDCVEMKHRAQIEIQRELEGKSVREQMEYWERRNAEFRKWRETLSQASPEPSGRTRTPRRRS